MYRVREISDSGKVSVNTKCLYRGGEKVGGTVDCDHGKLVICEWYAYSRCDQLVGYRSISPRVQRGLFVSATLSLTLTHTHHDSLSLSHTMTLSLSLSLTHTHTHTNTHNELSFLSAWYLAECLSPVPFPTPLGAYRVCQISTPLSLGV